MPGALFSCSQWYKQKITNENVIQGGKIGEEREREKEGEQKRKEEKEEEEREQVEMESKKMGRRQGGKGVGGKKGRRGGEQSDCVVCVCVCILLKLVPLGVD